MNKAWVRLSGATLQHRLIKFLTMYLGLVHL